MKILMLTPYLPYPPSSGGQIRSYNLIKQLSLKNEITLCSLIKHEDDKKYTDKLRKFCKEIYTFKRPEKPWTLTNILKTGFSTFPFLVIRNFSPSEKKALPRIIREGNFDIIHAETFYVSPHIPKTKIPIVLVDQTIESEVYKHFVENFKILFLRPLLYIDVLKLKYWERYYWKKAVRVIAVSDKDAQTMKEVLGDEPSKVRLVPNGVGEDLMDDVKFHFNKKILFVGNFAWLQNIEAARILTNEVFPLILEKIPDATLSIVGQSTGKIASLASDKVEVIDLASDDVEGIKRAYQTSGVLVAPLYGPGGTRLKILAAMAAKVPVITTKIGIAGLGENGKSYLEGETSKELADQTIKVLTDQKKYKAIAENARKLVQDNYSYQAIAEKLNKVYQEVVNA
jgi:polysaccharide biosynthesis protein PslH